MFNKEKFFAMIGAMLRGEENDMTATIIPTNNGKFQILTRSGIVGSYSRARDAIRGAKRRGFEIA